MPTYYLIPIVLIAVIFGVFYLFKGKIMAKAIAASNATNEAWANKDQVIAEFYENPDRLGPVKTAVGAVPEVLIGCAPKKGLAGVALKTAVSMATSVESFDMGISYLAITGGELHYLKSDGETIIQHDIFQLSALENLAFAKESGGMTALKYVMKSNGTTQAVWNLTFASKGEKYAYVLDGRTEGFVKFTVTKNFVYKREMGVNPFVRNFASAVPMTFWMYVAEQFEAFKQKIAPYQKAA